jgi:hypothetical protein
MKEQIFEIIERPIRQTGWDEFGNPICNDYSNKATEIDTLTKERYMRFAEWVTFSNESSFYPEKNEGGNIFWNEENDKYYTLEQVYNYWKEHINIDK